MPFHSTWVDLIMTNSTLPRLATSLTSHECHFARHHSLIGCVKKKPQSTKQDNVYRYKPHSPDKVNKQLTTAYRLQTAHVICSVDNTVDGSAAAIFIGTPFRLHLRTNRENCRGGVVPPPPPPPSPPTPHCRRLYIVVRRSVIGH